MREEQVTNGIQVLSQEEQKHWHLIEASIWGTNSRGASDHFSAPVSDTLLDQPRWLQPHFLYDEKGSRLFEQICLLPQYYLTRTEDEILSQEAEQIISLSPAQCIVELGAGFSKKTTHLLREQLRQREEAAFAPVDVSLSSLIGSRDALQWQLPDLSFHGLCARYEEGIRSIEKTTPTLFAFLGSSLGNFDDSDLKWFFPLLSDSMGSDDFLLLGVDRIKEVEVLERAYDDSQGLTAQFILNVFEHVNRVAGGNFDLEKMSYASSYNSELRQMEMSAVSTCDQEIRLTKEDVTFLWRKGEGILVEISRKFDPDQLLQQLRFYGLESVAHFSDPKEWFSLLLLSKG